jgi:hypothetical protein
MRLQGFLCSRDKSLAAIRDSVGGYFTEDPFESVMQLVVVFACELVQIENPPLQMMDALANAIGAAGLRRDPEFAGERIPLRHQLL